MSVLKEQPYCDCISGLKLKLKLGQKVSIFHKGESLTIQVAQYFSGWQVALIFNDPTHEFVILRDELLNNEDHSTCG